MLASGSFLSRLILGFLMFFFFWKKKEKKKKKKKKHAGERMAGYGWIIHTGGPYYDAMGRTASSRGVQERLTPLHVRMGNPERGAPVGTPPKSAVFFGLQNEQFLGFVGNEDPRHSILHIDWQGEGRPLKSFKRRRAQLGMAPGNLSNPMAPCPPWNLETVRCNLRSPGASPQVNLQSTVNGQFRRAWDFPSFPEC